MWKSKPTYRIVVAAQQTRSHNQYRETYLAVVDGDTLERPSPVPEAVDLRTHTSVVLLWEGKGRWMAHRGDRVVEREVAHGELLVAECGANVAAVEDEIADESAGAVLHEDALVLVPGRGGHLEDDVDQGSRLGDLPVDTGQRLVDGRAEIDD